MNPMKSRAEIKMQAKQALRNNYGTALVMTILYAVAMAGLSAVSFGIAGLILANALSLPRRALRRGRRAQPQL